MRRSTRTSSIPPHRPRASGPWGHRGLVLLWAAATAGCGERPPEWHQEGDVRWRALSEAEGAAAGFTRLEPRRTGVDFVNDPDDEMLTLNQHLANGAGVAVGDVNGDHRPDLFFTHTAGENRLYLNRGGFRFEDATDEAGVALPDRHPTGVALADVDGDGDLDALIAAMGAPPALLRNDGTGHFTDASGEAGFTLKRAGSTLTLADIDGDGDLDLYAANYRLLRAADVFSPEERRETPVLEERDGTWVVNEKYRDYYRVVMGPEGVMSWEFGEADDLYINDGSGRFRREPVLGPRFREADGAPLETEPQEWGLTARFRDLDDDGDPDLYVANDFESPDFIWMNDGRGRFRALGAPALRKTSHASMSVAVGDVDGDGRADVFVSDMLPVSTRLRKTQVSTLMERRPPPGDTASVMQVNRNTLSLQVSPGLFQEVARQAGVDASGWTWGTELVDVDLDGDLDLLVANGHRWDPLDADTGERLRRTQATSGSDWHEVINRFPRLRLPNRAFRNRGDGTFEMVEGGWGLDAGPDISHGLALGDLDGDGDLDAVVNRLGDEALVLRNDATAPRLAVRLRGRPPNTQAVGARIAVHGGPLPQTAEVEAGGLYLSHADGTRVFAAGQAESLRVEVRWPSGAVTVVSDARPGRLYELSEPDAPTPAPAERDTAAPAQAEPLFEDLRSALAHHHVERPFEERVRQPLLPRRLARLGPGLTWTDVDGDGDPDLVVGAGAEGRLAVLENRGVGFGVRAQSDPLPWDATTVLPQPGGTALVGLANYEAPTPEAARGTGPAWRTDLRRAGGLRLTPALSSDGASTGPLASADVDGDGDLDVFVGGRAYQGAYPITPRSRLFIRAADGSLVYDSVATAPFSRPGLVSGALFTDVDTDGDPDLVLALDWGPPRLYLNQGGRFLDATEAWGLAPHTGWWNGVAAGDFDGDGRPDLLVTNWGRNIEVRASPARPVLAYWGDFDRSGTLDVLVAQRDDRIGAPAPLLSLVELSRALPYVRRLTTPTFAAYADASVAEVLGPSMQTARVLRAATLDHTVFLNRGGRFEARPLPPQAQRAPAHGVAVADFDGDGHEDVFLAQNFFPNGMGRERHDAGRGLVLLGDGAGGFTPLPPHRAGVNLAGDGRGAAVADFDGDGRTDVAVGQNLGPTVLLANRRGTPGLRVRLQGPPGNPWGVGARLRVRYAEGFGPAREVRLGGGFWSVDDPVQVLGLAGTPVAVQVHWPGETAVEVPVPEGAREITIPWDARPE